MNNGIKIIIGLIFVLSTNSLTLAGDMQITHVRHDPRVLESPAGPKVTVAYRLNQAAAVTLDIYDPRDLLIRRLLTREKQAQGDHAAIWDGRDASGKWVLPNFYTYVIQAQAADGTTAVYDLSDVTGGRALQVPAAQYDPLLQQVSYVLSEAALVNVRIGLADGGPLLHTLLDWVPRTAGLQQEFWNGWDAQETLEIGRMQNYRIGVSAYVLPHNSIIVKTADRVNRPAFPAPAQPLVLRAGKARGRKQMYNHWQHPRDKCYDPVIHLDLLNHSQTDANGLPVIQGPVTLRLSVDQKDRPFIMDQRFEVVFYVDFIFVYEEELGYTPFNWQWDPHGSNDGVHHLTAMLRGYEGHFGTTTMKVFVKNPSVPKPLKEN